MTPDVNTVHAEAWLFHSNHRGVPRQARNERMFPLHGDFIDPPRRATIVLDGDCGDAQRPAATAKTRKLRKYGGLQRGSSPGACPEPGRTPV